MLISLYQTFSRKTFLKIGLAGLFILTILLLPRPALVQATAHNVIFGNIAKPQGVEKYDASVANESGIGLILFISNLIRVSSTIAGIWVMINFIVAGYMYITSSGDTGVFAKVSGKLTMSIIGLVMIVASYTVAGIIGLVIFDDASFIIEPKLKNADSITQ